MTDKPTMTRLAVHAPTCPAAQGHTVIAATMAADHALPHTCLPGGWAGTHVVEVAERIAAHVYAPGMYWPANGKAPLCRDCRQPADRHPTAEEIA